MQMQTESWAKQKSMKRFKDTIQTHETHIGAMTEMKLEDIPPLIDRCKWITRNRQHREGGGVALLIRQDLLTKVREITDQEDHGQEIPWIQLRQCNTTISIGVFYGKQERKTRDEITRQYSQLTTQILKLKQAGEVILMGDSKLEVNK